MKQIRTKDTRYDGIDASTILPLPMTLAIVVAIIFAAAIGFYALNSSEVNSGIFKFNKCADKFDALPLAERISIANWLADISTVSSSIKTIDVDPETYLAIRQEPEPLSILASLGIRSAGAVMLSWLLATALVFSLCTFTMYCIHRGNYYLCCLPYDRAYGRLLFLCMFTGWPAIFISFICMRVEQSSYYRQRHRIEQWEKQLVKELAEDELAEAARYLTQPRFPERAHHAFVQYVMKGQPAARKAKLLESEQEVASAKEALQLAGNKVREAQRTLNEARARNAQIVQSIQSNVSRVEAETEWEAIKNARGVSQIIYNRRRRRLEITIKVRVPYQGALYDFGDYRLYINGTSTCRCLEIRSGVKAAHTSTAPHYVVSGNQFCFGTNRDAIEGYLESGRYVEAITLVIECLHSVNGDKTAAEIPSCFRKVSTVDKAKRRILRRNKFLIKGENQR